MSKISQYRNTQTQVKHDILARYLDAWGSIIIKGLSRSKHQRVWKFVYIDCFAYKGKYLGDKENIFRQDVPIGPVYGSPIIGIHALDTLTDLATKLGIEIVTNAILIEKDLSNYHDLKGTLQECGFAGRVQETINFSGLNNGEIALINGDATSFGDKLTTFTNRSGAWAFYLIDPYGASGIPYDFVKMIVQGERHDVMINFIYEDLERKAGMAQKNYLNPQHKKQVSNWENAYGSDNWKRIVIKTIEKIHEHCYWRDDVLGGVPLDDMEDTDLMTDEQLTEIKERAFIFGYRQTLESMDPTVAIKLTALNFSEKDRTIFYLFLTTHDPTGALKLNQILYEAKFLEHELRYKFNTLRHIPRGQMSFWNPVENVPQPSVQERSTIDEIAEEIYQRLQGKCLTRKQVLISMTDSLFFLNEIDKALRLLKRQGKLLYEDSKLLNQTKLQFTANNVKVQG